MLPSMYFVLVVLATLAFKEVQASEAMVEIIILPANKVDPTTNVQFLMENTTTKEFSVCFYFKPEFRLNPNHVVILFIPGVLKIGINKNSKGGWLAINSDESIFDFMEPLFPRIWYSMCVQAGDGKIKIWLEDTLILDKNNGGNFEAKFQVHCLK